MKRVGYFSLVLVALVLIVSQVSLAGEIVTNEEVAQKAAAELAAKIEGELKLQIEGTRRIALRPAEANPFNDWFHDQLAPQLLDDGWDVWVLKPEQLPEEGSLLFEYRMVKISLQYLAERHGFLGLGTPKILREVQLELSGKLKEPESGRLFWQGNLESRIDDDFDSSLVSAVEADQPEWVTKPKLVNAEGSKSGFLEKVFIAGLVGTVVVLYISGAQ